jgi:hypothetical protein
MKKWIIVPVLLSVLMLAACATAQTTKILPLDASLPTIAPGTQNGTPVAGPAGQNGGGFNTLESRLAMGTLKLEGSSLAVTAEEAKKLLPLWEKVKQLSTTGTPVPADVQAAYKEIEAAMTPEQVQSIQQMTFSNQDFQTLLQSLGIAITPPASQPTLTANEQATRTAQRETRTAGGGNGNGGGFSRSGTPGAFGQGGQRGGFGGFSNMLIDPVIKLLTDRAK